MQSAMILLVTGEDPESEDGQRLTKAMKALEQVCCRVGRGNHLHHPDIFSRFLVHRHSICLRSVAMQSKLPFADAGAWQPIPWDPARSF